MEDDGIRRVSKRRLTICVIGSGGVGKSCLTLRYINGHFPEFYDPTIEESYVTQIEYGFHFHEVEVIDTAGQEEFLLFRDSSMAQGDAFLLVFAIDSVSSWVHLKELRSKIVREKDDDESIPMVVVGNKRDLEQDRQIPLEDVVEYCHSINCPLIETSAKTSLNVTESFRMLMEQVEEHRLKYFIESRITEDQNDRDRNRGACRIQ